MALDEFDEQNWVADMPCIYDGCQRVIAGVNFTERLIGLVSLTDACEIDWVRCENVALHRTTPPT